MNNLYPKFKILKKTFKPKMLRIKKLTDTLLHGEYGFKSKKNSYISSAQLESLRKTLNKKIKKLGKLWIRIFPHFFLTKKPLEVRMGNGKGNFSKWVVNIPKGCTIIEFSIYDKDVILNLDELFKDCKAKLGIPMKFIKKNDID